MKENTILLFTKNFSTRKYCMYISEKMTIIYFKNPDTYKSLHYIV